MNIDMCLELPSLLQSFINWLWVSTFILWVLTKGAELVANRLSVKLEPETESGNNQ